MGVVRRIAVHARAQVPYNINFALCTLHVSSARIFETLQVLSSIVATTVQSAHVHCSADILYCPGLLQAYSPARTDHGKQ